MIKNRLQRYGYHLMSLASIAQLVVVGTWLLHLFLLAEATGALGEARAASAHLPVHFFGATVTQYAPAVDAAPFGWIALALLPSLLASWWPWLQLRRFGKALYRSAPLSAPLADSLQWLGYAFAGSAVLTIIVTPLAAAILAAGATISLDLSGAFFIQLVAAICAFSMALVVREAVRVGDENKTFV